jgi:hypothetical protein
MGWKQVPTLHNRLMLRMRQTDQECASHSHATSVCGSFVLATRNSCKKSEDEDEENSRGHPPQPTTTECYDDFKGQDTEPHMGWAVSSATATGHEAAGSFWTVHYDSTP